MSTSLEKGQFYFHVWLKWPRSRKEEHLNLCLFLVSLFFQEDQSHGCWNEMRSEMSQLHLFFFQFDFLLFGRNTYSLVKKAIPFIVTGNYLFADTQVSDRTLYTLFFGTVPAFSGNI